MGQPTLTDQERLDAVRMIGVARDVADVALAYLLRSLETLSVSKHVYARRHRIKTEKGIEEKVERKRKEPTKSTYGWEEITDIIGLRFITLYRDDIGPVTESIFKSLLGLNARAAGAGPFQRANLLEFRFYMANASPENDPLAVRLKEFAHRHHKRGDKWKFRGPEVGERYSSVHFVTGIEPTSVGLPAVSEKKPPIPIEIQVRSVFEDAWGEVDHALLYEPRRLGVPMDPTFRHIERQSNALKKMLDAAADFADSIRSLKSPETSPPYPMRATLDAGGYVDEACKLIEAPDGIRKKLNELVAKKEEQDDAVAKGDTVVLRSDYVKLADKFAELRKHADVENWLSDAKTGDPQREIIYLIRMEEAVCRLLSLDAEQVPVAIDRLRRVVNEFSDHPVAWLRLGEAYARRMDVQEWDTGGADAANFGAHAYKNAAKELEKLSAKAATARFLAASDVQENYIRDNVSRLHAFLIWRAAHLKLNGNPPDAEALSAAQAALRLTHGALNTVAEPKARLRLLNSFAYFAAEAVDLSRRLELPEKLPCSRKKLRELLSELEQGAPRSGADALRLWDTVAYAHLILEGREAARAAANRVMIAHRDGMAQPDRAVAPYIREQEAFAVARALQIIGIEDE